jgi:hypothetical protein
VDEMLMIIVAAVTFVALSFGPLLALVLYGWVRGWKLWR